MIDIGHKILPIIIGPYVYTAKIQFKLGIKSSSSKWKFQIRECQKSSADRRSGWRRVKLIISTSDFCKIWE